MHPSLFAECCLKRLQNKLPPVVKMSFVILVNNPINAILLQTDEPRMYPNPKPQIKHCFAPDSKGHREWIPQKRERERESEKKNKSFSAVGL